MDFSDMPLPPLPPLPPMLDDTSYLARKQLRRAELKDGESETDDEPDEEYDGVADKEPDVSVKKKKRKAPSPAACKRQKKKAFQSLKDKMARDQAKFELMATEDLGTESEDEAYQAKKLARKNRVKKVKDPNAVPSQHRWQKHLRQFRVTNAEDCAGKSCAVISQLARVSYQPRPKCPTCNK